jgi:GDP-mannose 6-dehydrogenase
VVASGRLRATTDIADAIATTDISLICVGTPSAPSGDMSTAYLERVATQIGEMLAATPEKWHTVVFRSTMLPGTTLNLLVPLLEKASGLTAGVGFGVAVNPEFLREGSSVRDFFDPPKTVIGEHDTASGDMVAALYEGLPGEVFRVPIQVAEMTKYADNSFHGLKIAFANEIGSVCRALGIDSHAVIDVFLADRKLNVSPAYLKPGFAFGGSCLPKDLRATLHFAKTRDVELPVHAAIAPSNRVHIDHAIAKVMASGRRRIGMIGLSFKTGTDDLRESPLVALAEHFIGKGLQLLVYDPEVHLSNLLGANRKFIEQHVPHIGSLLRRDIAEVVAASDLLVVGLGDKAVAAALAEHVRPDQLVLDLVQMPGGNALRAQYEGLCWR